MEFSEGIFHHILVSGGGNIPSKLIQAIKNVYKLKLEQKIWKKSSRNRKEKKNIEHPVSNMISFRDTTKKRKIPRVTEIKKCKAGEKSTTNNYVNLRNYFWQACAPKFFISSSSTKSCKQFIIFRRERERELCLWRRRRKPVGISWNVSETSQCRARFLFLFLDDIYQFVGSQWRSDLSDWCAFVDDLLPFPAFNAKCLFWIICWS